MLPAKQADYRAQDFSFGLASIQTIVNLEMKKIPTRWQALTSSRFRATDFGLGQALYMNGFNLSSPCPGAHLDGYIGYTEGSAINTPEGRKVPGIQLAPAVVNPNSTRRVNNETP